MSPIATVILGVDFHDAPLELTAILIFFGLDFIWRRLVITESGYMAVDLSLFAVLESGFILVKQATDVGLSNVGSIDVFKALVALGFYVVLLFIFVELKQRNIEEMTRGFTRFVNDIADRQAHELAAAPRRKHANLQMKFRRQRDRIELVRQTAVETVWVNVFSAQVTRARGTRAKRIVDLLRTLGEGVEPPKVDDLYVRRQWRWTIGAGACTILVLVAAVVPAEWFA